MSEPELKEKIEAILEKAVEDIIGAIQDEKNTNNPVWRKDENV